MTHVCCINKIYIFCFQICVHPEVLSYVTNTVNSIRLLLKENSVFKVTVVVVTPDHKPAERFVFEVARPTKNTG